jgi:hypothetical protein
MHLFCTGTLPGSISRKKMLIQLKEIDFPLSQVYGNKFFARAKTGTDMTTPTPTSGQPNALKEDFITKHGKHIVVIIFSILISDALPTIIQNGLDPDELFYTIVLMSLPYTGSLVLIFLLWAKILGSDSWDTNHPENPFGYGLLGTALILGAGFALGYYTHWWGFCNADLNQIHPWFTAVVRNIEPSPSKSAMELPFVGEIKTSANRCNWPDSCNHPSSHKYCVGPLRSAEFIILFYLIMIFIQFYVTMYGLPMFIAATLASFVITQSILKGMEK